LQHAIERVKRPGGSQEALYGKKDLLIILPLFCLLWFVFWGFGFCVLFFVFSVLFLLLGCVFSCGHRQQQDFVLVLPQFTFEPSAT
jgi:hypothetical protein